MFRNSFGLVFLLIALVLGACSDSLVGLGPGGECGNGQVESGEACDDGNAVETDACTNQCSEARCGDQILRQDLSVNHDASEQCDDGNDVDEDACRSNCRLAVCGDGIVRQDLSEGEADYEGCDDGNTDNSDGCTNGCVSGADGDGDGVIDALDNCPLVSNEEQLDRDADGLGDDCDDEPDQRNFKLRSAGPVVLIQGAEAGDHKIQGRLAGQNQMSASSDRFKLKGGFHVELSETP